MGASAAQLEMLDVAAGYIPGHPVLRGVTLRAEPGCITVVLGPNGAGKSTALRVAAGFLAAQSGSVRLNGFDLGTLPPHRRAEHGMGLLPQGRSTFPLLSVIENIELSPIAAAEVYAELGALKREGRTILMVDQDIRPAIKIADYVYVLNGGRKASEGDRSAFERDLGALVGGWLGV